MIRHVCMVCGVETGRLVDADPVVHDSHGFCESHFRAAMAEAEAYANRLPEGGAPAGASLPPLSTSSPGAAPAPSGFNKSEPFGGGKGRAPLGASVEPHPVRGGSDLPLIRGGQGRTDKQMEDSAQIAALAFAALAALVLVLLALA